MFSPSLSSANLLEKLNTKYHLCAEIHEAYCVIVGIECLHYVNKILTLIATSRLITARTALMTPV